MSSAVENEAEKEAEKEEKMETNEETVPVAEESVTTEENIENKEDNIENSNAEQTTEADKAVEVKPSQDEVETAINEQELKYWNAVNENPQDFTSWTYLLQFVEQEVRKRLVFVDFCTKSMRFMNSPPDTLVNVYPGHRETIQTVDSAKQCDRRHTRIRHQNALAMFLASAVLRGIHPPDNLPF